MLENSNSESAPVKQNNWEEEGKQDDELYKSFTKL